MQLLICIYALADAVPEPLLPNMARRTGQARHMESDNEFSLDKALSRSPPATAHRVELANRL